MRIFNITSKIIQIKFIIRIEEPQKITVKKEKDHVKSP